MKQQAISTEKITFNENVFFKDAYRCSYFALMIYLRETETQRERILDLGKWQGFSKLIHHLLPFTEHVSMKLKSEMEIILKPMSSEIRCKNSGQIKCAYLKNLYHLFKIWYHCSSIIGINVKAIL